MPYPRVPSLNGISPARSMSYPSTPTSKSLRRSPISPVVVYSTDENCDRALALAGRLTELGYRNVRLIRDGIAN